MLGPLGKFFAITFAVTWTCFFVAMGLVHAAQLSGQEIGPVPGLLVFAGTVAPAFLALIISSRNGGIPLLSQRRFEWRVAARWYGFALGYMAAIRLVVAFLERVITGSWPGVESAPAGAVLVAIIISTPFQAGEEIGWRGYALPRLAERIGISWASVVLGMIWALWHLPLFFLALPGNAEYGSSFPLWAWGVTALSVAFAWLYVRTGGSLLLTMVMHSAVNNMPHFQSPSAAGVQNVFSLHGPLSLWLTAVCLWGCALYFLYRMRFMKPPSEGVIP